MAVRLSRRAGPEHPMLFEPGRDIPWPPRPPALPRPTAEADMVAFRAVLDAADALPIAELSTATTGRSVTVGGARLAADPLLPGDALLDDGTAVVPVVLPSHASAALKAALGTRFVLAVGHVSQQEGFVTLVADELRDLRHLNQEWKALSRR